MAEIIWSKVLTANMSPMTTAEGGNPSRWTGGMRRRLSYGEGCCNVHCKDDFVSMKFMVIKQKCNIVKVFGGIIKVTLVMMTKSFILPNFLKLLKRIFIYTKCCFDDFINVTLVCDDSTFNAHKVFKPLKRNNLQTNLLAVVITEAFFVLKGVSASMFYCASLFPTIKVSLNIKIPVYLKKMILSD